jgi:diguanylate cyclase (GGDEF)-like protein/PAS domain S-box-containing protein
MPDAVVITDAQGRFERFNPAFAHFFRYKSVDECFRSPKEMMEKFRLAGVDGALVPDSEEPIRRALRGDMAARAEYLIGRIDTGQNWIAAISFAPIRDRRGRITGTVLVAREISEYMHANQQLRASEIRLQTAFETSLDCVLISRARDGKQLEVNQALLDVLGYTRQEMIGHTCQELNIWCSPEERQRWLEALVRKRTLRDFQSVFRRKDGSLFSGIVSASLIDLEGELTILAVVRDISEFKRNQERIHNLAFFDQLTGLANRQLLVENLRKSLALAACSGRNRVLLMIGIDRFENINQALGYDIGDMLLIVAAKKIACCVREVDTISRLGGAKFVLLLEDLGDNLEDTAHHAKRIAERIVSRLEEPCLLEQKECSITCSVGITPFGEDAETVEDVLRHAEIALRHAKAGGGSCIRFYSPVLQTMEEEHTALERDLRQGIRECQFVLYFQPQYKDGCLVGAEALLRWQHPRLGLLTPDKFIRLAEETRLIQPLGRWVQETACRQISDWNRQYNTRITVAVNISACEMLEPNVVASILSALERTGANPSQLTLELTESMLAENMEQMIEKMAELKQSGIHISLDDFGTGYSSLAYLKRLPLDLLKIDLSFVRDLLSDHSSLIVINAIIYLSRALDLTVIAEGVETEEQKQLLTDLGCHAFQGYLFGRPVPAAEFEKRFLEPASRNILPIDASFEVPNRTESA